MNKKSFHEKIITRHNKKDKWAIVGDKKTYQYGQDMQSFMFGILIVAIVLFALWVLF